MRDVHQDEWDEFKDPEIVNWKRVRLAIEHENFLTNVRVTWLLSAQGFLLGAYMLVFTASTKSDFVRGRLLETQWVLLAIVLAGTLVSFFLARGVKAAHDQHTRLKKWWYKQVGKDNVRHPPICGNEPRFLVTVHYYKFPYIFLPVWLILAMVPFLDEVSKNQQQVQEELSRLGPSIAVTIVASVMAFLLGRARVKDEDNDG